MKITDLTHVIQPHMPVYPGTEPPTFERANTLERHGFREAKITMYSHTGTHMDAPAHMMANGATLDSLDVSHFIGPAVLVDCTACAREVGIDALRPYEESIRFAEFVVLRTDWSRHWGQDAYYSRFPALSEEAARWLCSFAQLKGVGVDAISIDLSDTKTYAVHKLLLGRSMVIVENLNNLQAITSERFMLSALPLRLIDADGSPVRAVAIEEC